MNEARFIIPKNISLSLPAAFDAFDDGGECIHFYGLRLLMLKLAVTLASCRLLPEKRLEPVPAL